MEIKVENIREYSRTNNDTLDFTNIPVVEGKLVLIDVDYAQHSEPGFIYKGSKKPIIISETEKIEPGVDYMYAWSQIQKPDKTYKKITGSTKKILALPEHFSKQQLQDIVDGKLKDGDELLVECVKSSFSKKQTSDGGHIHILDEYFYIKSPLSIYPIEEKMYTKQEVDSLFSQYNAYLEQWANQNKYNWGIYNGNVALNFDSFIKKINSREWFEQNVK